MERTGVEPPLHALETHGAFQVAPSSLFCGGAEVNARVGVSAEHRAQML